MTLVAEKQINIVVAFPDGGKREFPSDFSPLDIARDIGNKLYKDALGAKFDGELIDICAPLEKNGKLEILTFDSDEGKEIYWHSTSHLMAQAIKRIWPHAQIAIGPTIENGFYYDIDLDVSLTPEELIRIEREMKQIIGEDLPVKGEEISSEDALEFFKTKKEQYKIEIIEGIEPGQTIKVYKQGEFTDLCRGPHLPSTGRIKHFKLTSLAGAYWRGDERNKMLQRIYGISFPKENLLKEYLLNLENAKKRDHRKIGKALDLFSFHPESPGSVFWHGKGMAVYNEVVDYWRYVHEREGYKELKTPIILNESLWHKSGHWEHYKDNMYLTKVDDVDYALKPMNCPGGLLVYNNNKWSYKDFPLKFAELGLVHRYEKSGVLNGLFRVRQFTQDDAHVYCTSEQMKEEIAKIIKITLEIYDTFGFKDSFIEVSTKPKKSIGSPETWDHSEKALEEALQSLDIPYKVNKGEGAFYGPKIDFHIKDCLNRRWQCGTIQLDFFMPERLGADFVNRSGKKETPVMIHRAILGSLERFIGILIENYGGDFPFWLAPEQIAIIPVSEKHHDFALNLYDKFRNERFRVKLDKRNEKVGYKIRDNELSKIPYMLVIGDKEIESDILSVRRRLKKEMDQVSVDEFVAKLKDKRRLRQ